jgi:hypothetical protein
VKGILIIDFRISFLLDTNSSTGGMSLTSTAISESLLPSTALQDFYIISKKVTRKSMKHRKLRLFFFISSTLLPSKYISLCASLTIHLTSWYQSSIKRNPKHNARLLASYHPALCSLFSSPPARLMCFRPPSGDNNSINFN